MENDPSKKESKGKRIFKKAIRRNSKQSNNSSQNSALEQGIGVSRSKSFENKRGSIEINDSAPLPTPDGTKEKLDAAQKVKLDDNTLNQECALPSLEQPTDAGHKKNIQDARNQNKATPSGSNKGVKISSPKLEIKDERPSGAAPGVKKSLKRKLEEDSGAGTSGGASTGTSDTDADDKDPSKDKKKKNRCAVCRKKVGLTGFECRCGGLFCAVHRYSDKHECSFDYRELGAQEIRRNNPVVVSQKIHKI